VLVNDSLDFETWILDRGDEIIRKEHEFGTESLSTLENAVYNLWAVDYAVRNAGHMEALEELRPKAAHDLSEYLASTGHAELAVFMLALATACDKCEPYYYRFNELCRALQVEPPST
jgi:hypothetical protein